MFIEITRKAETVLWLRLFDNTHSHTMRANLGLAARDVLMKRGHRIRLLVIMLLFWGYRDDYQFDPQMNGRRALRRVVFEEIASMDPTAPLYQSAIEGLIEFAKIKKLGADWGTELEYLIREEIMQ